jgi:hypothetical protein
MGLMAHQMGGYDAVKAREIFNIPEQFTLMSMICVGAPADISTLTGDILARETAPRVRKPLGEIAFAGAWQQALTA